MLTKMKKKEYQFNVLQYFFIFFNFKNKSSRRGIHKIRYSANLSD